MGDREYRLRLRIDELLNERDSLVRQLERARKRRDYYKREVYALRRRRDDLKTRMREYSFELRGHRAREWKRNRRLAA